MPAPREVASGVERAAWAAVAAVVALAALPIAALTWHAGSAGEFRIWQDPYLLRVLRFSLLQATLSTLASVVPAILVARALARRQRFFGRRALMALLGVPLVVPSIAAVLGVVAVFGADGWLPLGRSLYGLAGILIAHVFFNLPLASRMLVPALEQVPAEQWRLGRQLGMNGWQTFRHIEWPALRGALPGTALVVFMLCLTSFAVVLTLGGGPRSTTLEVAIYQSLRYDFEPGRAVVLAACQLVLCALVAVLAARLTASRASEIGAAGGADFLDTAAARLVDGTAIAVALAVVGTILAAIIADGLAGPLAEMLASRRFWSALATSSAIAVLATTLACVAGWIIAAGAARLSAAGRGRAGAALEIGGAVVYVVPPLVIGTGYFLLMHGLVELDRATIAVVVVVNAMMGLPFVIRTLAPVMRQREIEYGRLCRSLGVAGAARFRIVDFPLLRRTLALAAALVAALSFGDLGVVALFAVETTTLPLLIYQYLAAYRTGGAAAAALLLLAAALALFVVIERLVGGRRGADR